MLRRIRTALKEKLRTHWTTDIEKVIAQYDETLREKIDQDSAAAIHSVRSEYTIFPRFAYHQPLDYALDTFPPKFDPPVVVHGETLPLPPVSMRMGYPADDGVYLDMGRFDHDLILAIVSEFGETAAPLEVFDLGCSTGRVLRVFDHERREHGWRLHGADAQAVTIEWMRRNFPADFRVFTCSVMPHLPLADNSLDVIYGISVFTHIKYLWDAWLLELRRVLKPGGLLIQTIHTENAWRFYHEHRQEAWVANALPAGMLETREMAPDFFYHGDLATSQVFWKRDIAREFWSRYLEVLDVRPPPARYSFQDWII